MPVNQRLFLGRDFWILLVVVALARDLEVLFLKTQQIWPTLDAAQPDKRALQKKRFPAK